MSENSFGFFFKQKTSYELRISDWSSDVCSSDLHRRDGLEVLVEGRDAHPRLRRQLGEGDRLLEVALQAADGAIDLLQPALADGDLPAAHALIGAGQAVADRVRHKRCPTRGSRRSIMQAPYSTGASRLPLTPP